LTLSSGGDLGIGTSSPAQTLHVKTSTAATPITLGVLSNSTTLPALSFNGAYASSTMAGTYSLTGSLYTTVPAGAAHYFAVADSIKATLDSSGNLLVGTTSSLSVADKLTVVGGNFAVQRSSGITTFMGDNTADGYAGTATNHAFALLTNSVERARIDSSGNLLVGKTSSSVAANGFVVQPSGNTTNVPLIACTGNSASASYITWAIYSTSAGGYEYYVDYSGIVHSTQATNTLISDERLKENIRDIDTGLTAIKSLKPRIFDWKENKGANIKNATGFIAQEFETVFPDSVGTSQAGEDGIEYKNINYEKLVPTLVKAIQELSAKVTALEAK
jgi:hypothetical protein